MNRIFDLFSLKRPFIPWVKILCLSQGPVDTLQLYFEIKSFVLNWFRLYFYLSFRHTTNKEWNQTRHRGGRRRTTKLHRYRSRPDWWNPRLKIGDFILLDTIDALTTSILWWWTWLIQSIDYGCRTTCCRFLLGPLPVLWSPKRLFYPLAVDKILFFFSLFPSFATLLVTILENPSGGRCQWNCPTYFASGYPTHKVWKYRLQDYLILVAEYFSVENFIGTRSMSREINSIYWIDQEVEIS